MNTDLEHAVWDTRVHDFDAVNFMMVTKSSTNESMALEGSR